MARAIADECLEPAYLTRVDLLPDDLGHQVVAHAQSLLAMKHSASRMARIWGGASWASIMTLRGAIRDLLVEYFDNGDLAEAHRCIQELDARYFHHEIVKLSFTMAADRQERDVDLAAHLIETAFAHDLVSRRQIEQGLGRLRTTLSDLVVDSPQADTLFERFTTPIEAGLQAANRRE